jgi:dTDP-4-amino-4,6-dideoxygalactose transaminase
MKVPLLDLKAQYAGIRDEVRTAVDAVLESQQFIMGPAVAEFEAAMAQHTGARHAIGVSSGTDALLVALMALDVRPGDRVITPTYSFFATAGVVTRLGAVPVLVDIDAASYNLSVEELEKTWVRLDRAARARVKAIVPVHLYGQCADMAPIMEFARQAGVPVIEDAAQAIGCAYAPGQSAGTIGLMGCFSFFPSKNLGGIGDAGMVVAADDTIAERLRLLRNHGAKPKYYHREVGGNFRLDTIQAAVLQVKLKYLDGWTAARCERAARYRTLFHDRGLAGEGGVGLPEEVRSRPGLITHIYNQFVIRVSRRDALREFLTTRGVGTEIYYPVPFHLQECFRDLGHREGDFPEAERAARETLALPVYPELTAEQQAYVVDTVRAFVRAA